MDFFLGNSRFGMHSMPSVLFGHPPLLPAVRNYVRTPLPALPLPPHSRVSRWPFQSVGGPDDVLETKGAACKEISNLLARVGTDTGEYSFGDSAPMLPSLPGLTIKNVGLVSLPLRKENVASLQTEARKITDNLWMLGPSQVEMQNPEWNKGIKKLSKLAAERLGFTEDIKLHPELAMVVLYGEGGRLDVQQAVDRSGRSVAALEVMLPSVYTGGALVVEEEGPGQPFRYLLGADDGTAEFEPHFVVYTTGAYRSVEEVTSGYRLGMVYALCLPPDMQGSGGKRPNDFLPVQLAEAMKKLGANGVAVKREGGTATTDPGSDYSMFALMVSNLPDRGYSGVDSLVGVDKDRFQLLSAANLLIPPTEKLQFYIVRLQFKCFGGYSKQRKEEKMSWQSLAGDTLKSGVSVEWSKKLNFLNPGKETLKQLWTTGGSNSFREHERFCIVGWRKTDDFRNVMTWIGESAVTTFALADSLVDGDRLRGLFRFEAEHNHLKKMEVRIPYLQQLAKCVSESGDRTLVDDFLKLYLPRLQNTRQAIPVVALLLRNAGWEAVTASFISAVDQLDNPMGMALRLSDTVKDAPARAVLLSFAVEKAQTAMWKQPVPPSFIDDFPLLWRAATEYNNSHIFHSLVAAISKLSAELLGVYTEPLLVCAQRSRCPEHRQALVAIASRRLDWLAGQATPEWKISQVPFPDAREISSFLQGPLTTLVIRGFNTLTAARVRVALLKENISGPLAISATARGKVAIVQLVKSGVVHTEEIARLQRLVRICGRTENENIDDSNTMIGQKRSREGCTSGL